MATLHPRLAADTRALGETDLCWLRWMNDRRFAWLIVVPKREGLRSGIICLLRTSCAAAAGQWPGGGAGAGDRGGQDQYRRSGQYGAAIAHPYHCPL